MLKITLLSFALSNTLFWFKAFFFFKYVESGNKGLSSTQLKRLSETLCPTDALSNYPGNSLLLQCRSSKSEVYKDQREKLAAVVWQF